ncbi:MAG: enoyl-CoA hydratase/isomerase family protein [Alphaproteobacteria bacterium]|nr:enoyl-CoA hydratase/isomerase family protein [Alphaproteobacteria bacterium]
MVSAGLADYLVKKESFESILQDISAGQTDIVKIIQSYSVTISSSDQFLSLSEFCDAHFRFTDAQTILSSLGKESSEQAVGLLVELRSRSPLSVLVALAHYNRGMDDDFDTIIERDYQLCARFIQGDDLYEGIRALLIDKDKSPRWQHDSIESVPESDVDVCFVPCVPPLASVAL